MKHAILMLVLQLASNGADAYLTNRNLHTPRFVERNPLERPFVHNTGTLAGSFAVETSGALYLEHLLRKRGHAKLATALELDEICGHGFSAGYSLVNANNGK